jgi:transcriptional regulator with XRE-family HTH domain
MGIGARIATLRRDKNESLQDVAAAVGVTKTHIWELERGRTENPSLKVIQRLADHFGVSVASLVGEDINAEDTNQKIGRMFRLASNLDPQDLETIDDMIEVFIRRKKERAADRA